MKNLVQYQKLFLATATISLFSFGGGYVVIALMQRKFVEELKWVDKEEMLDMIAIAQAAPGIMAVNAAIIIGRKLAGFKGSLVATLGTILPPFTLIFLISFFYNIFISNHFIATVLQGMQAVVAAIIIGVALNLFAEINKKDRLINLTIFIVAFVLDFFLKINIIYLVIGAIVYAIIRYYVVAGEKQ